MTWLSYGISLLLLALVGLEYYLAHVAHDRRTRAHKRTSIIVLIVALLSIAAQQIVKEVEDRKKSTSDAELRGKLDAANTNIAKLLTHQSELLAALSTNSSIPAKLRVEILEHSRAVELVSADISDLEQWKTDFKNEQAAAKQKQQVAGLKNQIALAEQNETTQRRVEQTWKRAKQLYDFIIRTLQQALQSAAKTKGDKVFSDYAGLPAAPTGDKSIHVASITTGTNLGWFFEVSADAIPRGDSTEVWLRVFGSCTDRADRVVYQTMFKSSEVSGNPGTTNVTAESHLMLTPSHTDFTESINLEGYQTNATAWVRRFIGALATRCDSR